MIRRGDGAGLETVCIRNKEFKIVATADMAG
jgi:hypothetical protein